MKREKIKARCEIMNASESAADMYLYGTVTGSKSWYYDDDEYICPQNVKNTLDEAGGKDITVHLNSYGGDVFAGISIYNMLRNYSGKVTIHIDGIAASAASVIAMAGETIKMPATTQMMVHKAWTFAAGNADDFRKTADDMDKIDSSILEAYKERFVGTEEELKALIENETYLTAEECKAFGFCDEDQADEEGAGGEEDIKNTLLSKYMNSAQKNKKNVLGAFKRGEK